jgi:GR25 family glycosyltransferase involved in LPS biosynthesis
MTNEEIDKAVVFEDDVFFHKDWKQLAPLYMSATPQDYDILYLGSQMEMRCDAKICRVPVYCTHAYIITREGARKLYDTITKGFPRGMSAIDSLLIETMYKLPHTFNWLVWNGMMYHDARAVAHPEWAKRNCGLVFQDPAFGTDVKPRDNPM